MNPFFIWLIKSSVSMALLYIVFKLATSRDKIHAVNRFLLLGILVVSTVLPFINLPVFQQSVAIPKIETIREFVAAPLINNTDIPVENIQNVEQTNAFSINLWLVFYLSAIFLLFLRLLISTIRIWQIIRRAEKQTLSENYPGHCKRHYSTLYIS